MDGDVDGADAQVNDPLSLPGGEVGEGDVIAHEEAEPRVVILKIEGVPAAGGHLVHKAEQTVVAARPGLVHEVGLKVEAQLLRLPLLHPQGAAHAVGSLQHQQGVPVIAEKAVVQHILHVAAADGDQLFAGPHAGPLRRGAAVNGGDDIAHRAAPSWDNGFSF